MASSPSLDPRSGRHNLPPPRSGASKTQASLARIIGVISTVPPPSLEPPRARGDERGTRLDLRLRLGLATEIGGGSAAGEGVGPTARCIAGGDHASGEVTAAEESISAAESVAGEGPASKSSESECDPSGSGGRSPPKEALPGHGKEYSEITNVREGEEEEPKEITEDGGGKEEAGAGAGASNGYLDLLLEAVREVLGGFLDEEHEGAAGAEEEKKMEAAGESRRRSRRSRRRRRRERRCRTKTSSNLTRSRSSSSSSSSSRVEAEGGELELGRAVGCVRGDGPHRPIEAREEPNAPLSVSRLRAGALDDEAARRISPRPRREALTDRTSRYGATMGRGWCSVLL
ncbi:serine/arginine repetitive matrix protein 3-like [Ananas comosus]|uniref:Serine/arginine repetitive matrix protein 3-like n=1 Tax=Ananas comosus TaxID=4615 RepID=A0A6P5GFD5_ANACO|nr:serine/arginine repetitive matrix protein 3-like [Ananas comosus]